MKTVQKFNPAGFFKKALSGGAVPLAAAALAALILGSCVSGTPAVWDDSYPESQLTTVKFNGIAVSGYNGISVEKWYTVKIPAGDTLIGGDVTIYHGGLTFQARGMEFNYRFEAGEEYQVSGASRDMKWGVRIHRGLSSGAEEIAFVPFIQQPVF
jgi:hypothetical protein